jgi:hypothetical protein
VYTTNIYEDAKDGQAWANINGVWQWTINPTPGLSNILALQTVAGAAAKSKTTQPKKSTKKATTKKTTKPKTAKTKSTKSNTKDDDKDGTVAGTTVEDDGSSGFSPQGWMIAGVAVFAVGYLLYEYKDDIRNKFLQLRRNGKVGRSARETT